MAKQQQKKSKGTSKVVAKTAAILSIGVVVLAALGALRAKKSVYSKATIETAARLVRHASQCAVMAHQDSQPLVALAHISEGLASARTALSMMPQKDLLTLSGVDVELLVRDLEKMRDSLVQHVGSRCPQVMPNGPYVNGTRWMPPPPGISGPTSPY